MKDVRKSITTLKKLNRCTNLHEVWKLKREFEDINLGKDMKKCDMLSLDQLIEHIEDLVNEVERLSSCGKFPKSIDLDVCKDTRGDILPTSTLSGETTTMRNMDKIYDFINRNVRKIGVHGIGGIGKTTAVKLVSNRILEDKNAIQSPSVEAEAGTSSSKDDITGGSIDAERNKFVFFQGGIYSFDLEDLLRASAEVLGKGSIGTSYKVVLEEGSTVVVKRLKDVVVAKKEFESTMAVVGKMKHENVVPVRAFYYSKDEKLLVLDFMGSGSLSASLHGSRGSGRTPLDWSTRLKIALSTARGLSHLHVTEKLVHGNLKASNVLLRPDYEASLSDFGLNLLFGTSTPPNRVAGYCAPEVLETQKVTFKSDVYSFGVLLLELLTGKAPDQASLREEGIDLPRWVQSVVKEEWTAEVFDVALMRYEYDIFEEEMVQLLQIAMTCVAIVPYRRPETGEVVRLIEEICSSEGQDALKRAAAQSQ